MDKSKWEYKRLGDCFAYIKNGANIKQVNGATGIPITRIETLSNDVFNRDRMGYANIDDVTTYSSNILNDGDILMSHINSMKFLGRAVEYKKIDEEVIIHGMNLLRMIPTSNFLSSYAVYQFKTDHFRKQIKAISHQAVNQASFNVTNLKGLNLIVPPISDQQRIVAELDCLNEMIALKQGQLKEFDKLAQSIFYDMFGDPIANEKGWDKVLMKQVIKVVGGYAFKSELFKDKGIPVLRIGNINTGEFRPINMVYWKEDDKLSRYAMYPGDLVVSLTGTVGKDDYGNVCILDNSYDKYYLNQRNAKLEILGNVEKLYLSRLLKIDEVKAKLTGTSRGVRQANISNRDIENLVIPLPPLALQQQFAEKIQAIEAQKELVKQSIAETQQLLDSRMDYYFD